MTSVTIACQNVRKSFNQRKVLSDVSFSATSGECVGIVGDNGAGKSTMIKVLAGLIRPDGGTTSLVVSGTEITPQSRYLHIGLVAPYLNLYEEFTTLELLSLQQSMRDSIYNRHEAESLLARLGLHDRRNDAIKTLSSGLRQRAMIAVAVFPQPDVLFFDEPSVTLDTMGRKLVEHEILLQLQRNGIVLLATNDIAERDFCTRLHNVQS